MAKKKSTVLEWKRAKKDETELSVRRTWDSRCGLYRVQESISRYGLPTVYYALQKDKGTDCFFILSRHRKRKPAEDACEKASHQRRRDFA
jgi:hypothetical protein